MPIAENCLHIFIACMCFQFIYFKYELLIFLVCGRFGTRYIDRGRQGEQDNSLQEEGELLQFTECQMLPA